MSAERSRQVEQLYHAARERDPAQRAVFLDQACAGDQALRHEVDSLLAEDASVESFLETPALDFVPTISGEDAGQSLIGRRLGSYQCVSLLGKGGMGEVYRARDTQLHRDVALKLLPSVFFVAPLRRRENSVARRLSDQLRSALHSNAFTGSRSFFAEFHQHDSYGPRDRPRLARLVSTTARLCDRPQLLDAQRGAFEKDFRNAYTEHWSFGFQRQLSSKLMLGLFLSRLGEPSAVDLGRCQPAATERGASSSGV